MIQTHEWGLSLPYSKNLEALAKNATNHPNPAVRRASLEAILDRHNQYEQMARVRMGRGGPMPHNPFRDQLRRVALPALSRAWKDENADVRNAAAEALKEIDPDAAAKAGVK